MTDPRLAIVVLAAGQGTRMKSATPKLLHELAGVPLIGHVLATAREMDAAHLITVVRHERDRVAEAVAAEAPESTIVDQDEVAGTGRAVEVAIATLPADFDGDVLVVYGDVPLLDGRTLRDLLASHRSGDAAATILSSIPADPAGYGRVVRTEDGHVDRIVEHKDASEAERRIGEINSGTYVFGVSHLRDHLASLSTENAQGEKYLTDMVSALRRAGAEVDVLPVGDSWRVEGVNDRAQLSEAAARLNALLIRGWQLAGVTVQDPATTWIDVKARLSEDVTLLPGTQVLGATVVSRGAKIGPDTTLRDCEIGEDASVVRTDATLSVIGPSSTVGPFAYLRAGTILGANAKIGTFSETKNARIGDGTKLAHFNYVGDAEVGERSNLGAGVITANYDGVNKHRTEIGSGVRAGTNTVFVAPVRMGDGAYTGAGTVVRKDIPAGALGINVAPQRNIEGWVATHRPGTDAAKAAEESGE
jgi:bifunctional UDP-N-acetylglucosamine pyrophosphorylase/glucosamine-1-phosphate N-acetyltransferase